MVGWVGVSMWFETYSTLRYQILTFWLKIWYLGFLFPLLWCQPSSLPHLTCGAPWLDVGRVITLWGILLHWRWGNAEGVPQWRQSSISPRCGRRVRWSCHYNFRDWLYPLRSSHGFLVWRLLQKVRRVWHFLGCVPRLWQWAPRLSPVWGRRGHLRRRTRSLSPEPPPEQCRRGGDGVLDHGLGNRIRPARRGGDGHRDHLRGIGAPYRQNRRRDPPRVQGPGRR